MNGVSTVTQKGQVVIPQPIRDLLGLKPTTRVYIKVKDDFVMIKPVLSIDRALGMIKTKKHATEEEYDEAIRKRIIKKYS